MYSFNNKNNNYLKIQTELEYNEFIKIKNEKKERKMLDIFNIQKFADNFKESILRAKFKNKNRNNNNMNNNNTNNDKEMMNLIKLARSCYDLKGISDKEMLEAIEKSNGNIDEAVILLLSK